ncbi:MAG: spondin domain-containing protein, partial [Candidatus Nomurabacteria bacterium]|nr:spondin domain-containing protein [Candidatus Nomurabacteria bacterium]
MENKNSGKTWVWLVIAIAIIAIITLSAKKEQPVPTETLSQTYTVTINNSSESQPLAPGVYIIHTDEASLDFADTLSPAELEPLAEYGSNTDFATFAGTLPGVVDVITIDAPILPGESTSFEITANTDGLFLSGIQMAVASNDGYALVNAIPLTGQATITPANNYDNGTEENSELGS